MYKKNIYFFTFLFTIIAALFIQIMYLKSNHTLTDQQIKIKNEFVRVTSLPDLAISTETTYIRHRTLTDLFAIYPDDGSLREYFPSSYTFSHSNILNNTKGLDAK